MLDYQLFSFSVFSFDPEDAVPAFVFFPSADSGHPLPAKLRKNALIPCFKLPATSLVYSQPQVVKHVVKLPKQLSAISFLEGAKLSY